jgi:peptide/nickel transport system substrate-binding protein
MSFKYREGARAGVLTSLIAGLGIALMASASAANCPTVADPQGVKPAFLQQLDLDEFKKQTNKSLTFTGNPMFAERVKSGELPPVAERLPAEPLVVMPYDECGKYGGTLRGLARKYESGTSEILAWRQDNMVRIADDGKTIVPNVAKSWKWNADFTEITLTLRKGHKWSDGAPFTADDVTFWANDIINNKDIHKAVPAPWDIGIRAEKIDETTVKLIFAKPYPAFLNYNAGIGSYFTIFEAKHFLAPMHIKYNPKADEEAKAAGFDNWVQRFTKFWNKWKDATTAIPEGVKIPTLESHIMVAPLTTQRRNFEANPYFFKVDTSGQQLPYIDKHNERFLNSELWPLEIMNGNVDQKSQNMPLVDYPILKENEVKGGYTLRLPPGAFSPPLFFNQTHKDPELRKIYADVRFRQAMSLAMNRDELNEIMFLGLGKPRQAVPIGASWVTPEQENYLTEYDPKRANALLDEIGLKKGADGMRLRLDGKPLVVLWEYTTQYTYTPEFPTLIAGWWKDVGVQVITKEITTQLHREQASVNNYDIHMGWANPFEPVIIADIAPMVIPFEPLSPKFIPWRDWLDNNGTQGDEPPAWAKRLHALGKEWPTVVPGSDRYLELGKEMVKIHQDNLIIIGTVGSIPITNVVSNKLGNVPKWTISSYGYGYSYGARADQWYFKE